MEPDFLELELIEPLHQIQTIEGMVWDALGELLILQAGLRSELRPELLRVRIAVSAEAAAALRDGLPQALAERPGGATARQ